MPEKSEIYELKKVKKKEKKRQKNYNTSIAP